MTTLSVIIPATNRPATLAACLDAIAAADEGPEELIVVEEPPGAGPAAARNLGAARATGDVLVFVDADVEVDRHAFTRIRGALDRDPDLAAVFGSYDDDPGTRTTISIFRNLLHHHVHQSSPGPAGTFWAGLGAIRRAVFVAAGGFVDHPIEDIELGMRLTNAGARIELDPLVQGKHLKGWTLWSMVRTDLLVRGIPWVGLLLRDRSASTRLNLGWRHRLSALASIALVAAGAIQSLLLAAAALGLLVILNWRFYALLVRRAGPHRALAGIALHVLHHLVGVVALAAGMLVFLAQRRRREPVIDAAGLEAAGSLTVPEG